MLPVLWERVADRDGHARGQDQLRLSGAWQEFARRREGMCFALDGGVWLHRWRLRGAAMVHLVSADRERLLELGRALGFQAAWLQYKPLKDPRTGQRLAAWHWDVWGSRLARLDPPKAQPPG